MLDFPGSSIKLNFMHLRHAFWQEMNCPMDLKKTMLSGTSAQSCNSEEIIIWQTHGFFKDITVTKFQGKYFDHTHATVLLYINRNINLTKFKWHIRKIIKPIHGSQQGMNLPPTSTQETFDNTYREFWQWQLRWGRPLCPTGTGQDKANILKWHSSHPQQRKKSRPIKFTLRHFDLERSWPTTAFTSHVSWEKSQSYFKWDCKCVYVWNF